LLNQLTPVNTFPKPRTDSAQASPTEARRQQILQYIRENGIVSIKDIASGVRGVSDKTLQRALIELVNDKIIIRHGDRRWSRYEAVM
jgi:predicted ArsR family transcriptional regulator